MREKLTFVLFLLKLKSCTFSPLNLKWVGITSKDLSESVLLEAALFGGVSENLSENSRPASHLQNDKIQGTRKGGDLQPVPCSSIASSSTQQSHQQKV